MLSRTGSLEDQDFGSKLFDCSRRSSLQVLKMARLLYIVSIVKTSHFRAGGMGNPRCITSKGSYDIGQVRRQIHSHGKVDWICRLLLLGYPA